MKQICFLGGRDIVNCTRNMKGNVDRKTLENIVGRKTLQFPMTFFLK